MLLAQVRFRYHRGDRAAAARVSSPPTSAPARDRTFDFPIRWSTIRGGLDPWIVGPVFVLLSLGLVMVFSASAFIAERDYGSHGHYLWRQAVFALIGLAVMALAALVDYRVTLRFTYPLVVLVLALLALVLVSPFGHAVGGARRWLVVGNMTIQPAEFAKPALILYLAQLLPRKGAAIRSFSQGLLPALIVLGVVLVLLLLEPDLGTALLLAGVVVAILVAAGAWLPHVALLGLLSVPVLLGLIWNVAYRRRRLLTFLDPWADPSDAGFQIVQSFLAFASGGAWGVGLGDGRQKLFFLPEPHTDFIFSVIGEELGLVGTIAAMAAVAVLIWRAVAVARRTADPRGALLAFGVAALLGGQSLIHMGVAVGILPTKGLPLPLVSYGGSSLTATMLCIGLLLSVAAPRHVSAADSAADGLSVRAGRIT
ncbi:MAG: putative lipid II flippase FtsW [Candidatus Schekmanbacteria bacterium]|nr:putative lipid II flippase FtsW [Candidatus Schekmanbacteria bacterium]